MPRRPKEPFALLQPAELRPLQTASERLIAAADAALYRAKRAGRNVVRD